MTGWRHFLRALVAVAVKEGLHAVRDRLTLILLISVPLVQLLLFGYAINLHPRNLPTVLVAQESDAFVDYAVQAVEKLGYFTVVHRTQSADEARLWLAKSRAQFVLELPQGFGKLVDTPPSDPQEFALVQLTADATDPIAAITAVQAASAYFAKGPPDLPVRLLTHLAFNPEGASRLFIIPGLLGVILTLTVVLLGALTMVREREQGTLEMLGSLSLPHGALLLGKALPYFAIGCALFVTLLGLCTRLLDLAWPGSSLALFAIAFLFVAANLMLGLSLSLIASNAMQAMQLGIFFYLPSMLLSGFMFPFFGMPTWAQRIGEVLPLTHFLRVVRGILLKDLPDSEAWILAWPIAVFALVCGLAAALLYRWRRS